MAPALTSPEISSRISDEFSIGTLLSLPEIPTGLTQGSAPNIPVIYTCTVVLNCDYRGMSYISWFLHETCAHHGGFDMYFCNCFLNGGQHCTKACLSAKEFDVHRATHVHEPLYLHSGHVLGPRQGEQFWCGFCGWVYNILEDGCWYATRSQHVINHFNGTFPNCGREWKFPEFLKADG